MGLPRFPVRTAGRCDPAGQRKMPRLYPALFLTVLQAALFVGNAENLGSNTSATKPAHGCFMAGEGYFPAMPREEATQGVQLRDRRAYAGRPVMELCWDLDWRAWDWIRSLRIGSMGKMV